MTSSADAEGREAMSGACHSRRRLAIGSHHATVFGPPL
jgi:hypothetical protein